MESLSIIVTACNNAATIAAALRSVEEALAFFHREQPRVATEVVVVDDGSGDDTPQQVRALVAGRDDWKLVRRDECSSAARARNTGVRHARGEVLCFLDGDDVFLAPHLAVCWRTLANRDIDYVKTGVRLADPVHADWKPRIEHTLIINLAIRRTAHDALGGFPDYHLFRYEGEGMRHELDIFRKCEDVFYNWLAQRQLRGCRVLQETVAYRRHRGNAYDRQYAKFCRSFAESRDDLTAKERFSVRLGEVIYRDLLARRQPPTANGRVEGVPPLPSQRGQQEKTMPLSSREAETLVSQGLGLAEQGRAEEAIALLQRAAQLQPHSPRFHHNLGVALAQRGRHDEAVAALEQALRLRPDYADACFNLGNALRELGRRDEAIARFQQALRLRPEHANAGNNLGLTLTEARRAEEAVEVLRGVVALQPRMKEGHNNLGLAYVELGRFAEAEACYQQALRLDPGYAEAHTNLGSACKEQGRLEEALACYQQALWLEPDSAVAHYNRALALLQRGDYERGWPEYEWRWQRRQARPQSFGQPRWDGGPLAGRTILLWREQGLGDTIQFVRYAALAAQQGGRVVVECPACLVPLLRTCSGIDELVAEKQSRPAFDVQAPLLSLPALLHTTLDSIPASIPYLWAEPERVAAWWGRLGEGRAFRIGVVWQGNPYFRGDRHRSFPLASLAPLAAVAGVQLVSLQKEHGLEQLMAAPRRFPVTVLEGLDALGGAFLDTAAVMRSLDLVVTADTAAAHVAGALGVPVWLALSRAPDWRWGLTAENTPWYPSMRLFRQSQLGDWRSVFERMAAQLRRELPNKIS
jgi:tetratricopeptide (TPR) repeat protein